MVGKLMISLTADNLVTVIAMEEAGNGQVHIKLDREAALSAARELDKLGRMLPFRRK